MDGLEHFWRDILLPDKHESHCLTNYIKMNLQKRVIEIYLPDRHKLTFDLVQLILEMAGIVRFGKKFIVFEINM